MAAPTTELAEVELLAADRRIGGADSPIEILGGGFSGAAGLVVTQQWTIAVLRNERGATAPAPAAAGEPCRAALELDGREKYVVEVVAPSCPVQRIIASPARDMLLTIAATEVRLWASQVRCPLGEPPRPQTHSHPPTLL